MEIINHDNKIKTANQNDHSIIYKWIKTEEFSRGYQPHP